MKAPNQPDRSAFRTPAQTRCCPVCWQYGYAIPLSRECRKCSERQAKLHESLQTTTSKDPS